MRRRRHGGSVARALRATTFGVAVVAMVSGCASSERAERQREIAALRSQFDEIRRGQEANAKELARLSGEMKALDAQSTFVISEVKASSEERARTKAAIEESDKTLREVQSAVDGLRQAAVAPPASPSAASSARSSSSPETSPQQLYAAAMAHVQAEEHAQAIADFSALTKRFPEDPLASNAQYWIGETRYRQRDFAEAVVAFRKVVDGYPTSAQVPEALLKIGLCHRALKDQARARVAWEQVVKEYPETNAATQARSLLTTVEGASAPAR
jgi:tol-pal system protein YbgF